jgi:hypothetical protein
MIIARRHSMDSVNLEDLTMFCRTVLTSSSRLRIKGCRSYWKEDSKFYTQGMKSPKYGHGLMFCQKITPTTISICNFLQSPQWKFPTTSPEDSPGPKHRKKQRIPKSAILPTIRPYLATFSPMMGATEHSTDSINLKDLAMFRRTVLEEMSNIGNSLGMPFWKFHG